LVVLHVNPWQPVDISIQLELESVVLAFSQVRLEADSDELEMITAPGGVH
jgi:hypothetical protein